MYCQRFAAAAGPGSHVHTASSHSVPPRRALALRLSSSWWLWSTAGPGELSIEAVGNIRGDEPDPADGDGQAAAEVVKRCWRPLARPRSSIDEADLVGELRQR